MGKGKGPLKHTRRVMIELSNLCNLAWYHKKCPLNRGMGSPTYVKDPVALPSKIVYHILDTLAQYDYRGILSFHYHSEPLMDPRLFMFIHYAIRWCPEVRIYLITNGIYLEQTIASELLEAGVQKVFGSLYGNEGEKEKKRRRYKRINKRIGFTRWGEPLIDVDERNKGEFDDRLNWYGRPHRKDMGRCGAPLAHLLVNHNADVGLCCWEWKQKYTFGNLNDHVLEEIILSPKVQETYKRLMSGDRFLDYCKTCHTRQT